MSQQSDVLVVGSGASAVHAATAILEHGRSVTMIDVGEEESDYGSLIPDAPFEEIRRTDLKQHLYFLGRDFEGIPLKDVGAGPQVPPPRQYVFEGAQRLLPIRAPSFAAVESLAIGGLAGAWGAVSFPFLDSELSRCGLPPDEMRRHYEVVARRIGISGSPEDLAEVSGALQTMLSPLELDHNADAIFGCYHRKRELFRRERVRLGRPYLAVLTRDFDGRRAHPYHDMDFWSNKGESVYRPELTVRKLMQHHLFRYCRRFLVTSFGEESTGVVAVRARSLEERTDKTFYGRRLVLAAGALGTTRIVLRSLRQYDVPVPLLSNPHTYVPCLHLRALGKTPKARTHSLAQLTMVYDPDRDSRHLVQAQLYSYRSLLLFRLLRMTPLAGREALKLLRTLAPCLMIWVVQHEDEPSAEKSCVLRRGTNTHDDLLEIHYRDSAAWATRRQMCERVMVRAMRRLGCWLPKVIHERHGSSIHYGGQFPMTTEDRPLTTEPSGLLRGTRAVYLADGSTLHYLPAKGLTFTLMANADRIGHQVIRSLEEEP